MSDIHACSSFRRDQIWHSDPRPRYSSSHTLVSSFLPSYVSRSFVSHLRLEKATVAPSGILNANAAMLRSYVPEEIGHTLQSEGVGVSSV